jgi:molecular chaperone GrpE
LNKEGQKVKRNETEEPDVETSTHEEGEAQEKDIQKDLDAIKKQLVEEKDRCLRLNAEFENSRKRIQKEKEEFIKYANEKLILELIEVFESLERGIENAKKVDKKDKLIEGMELVVKQFRNVLEKNGLTSIKAVGEKFDHNRHEAMMQTCTDECDEDIILEEYARGYMLNGKVIRYSKVRVSKENESENKINEVK